MAPLNRSRFKCSLALTGLALFVCSWAFAGEKKAPAAEGSNDLVEITATYITPEQLKQMVGTDFGSMFTTLEVRVAPKNGKPVEIRYDDFVLLSEATGEHGSPYEPGQISGSGALVLHREDKYGSIGTQRTSGVWALGPIMAAGGGQPGKATDNRADMAQGDSKTDPLTDVLKQKMLPQKTAPAPESGLLIFPLQHEKAKHLVLMYKTASGKLRMTFKQ